MPKSTKTEDKKCLCVICEECGFSHPRNTVKPWKKAGVMQMKEGRVQMLCPFHLEKATERALFDAIVEVTGLDVRKPL